jgi:tetratricopeptide (TPR) repeat protein
MRAPLAIFIVCVATAVGCSRPSFDTFLGRGQRHLQAHRFAEAAIEFENAARERPESADAQMRLGDAYRELGRLPAAAAAYDRACAIDERSVIACIGAASALLAIGDYENAAARARDVLSADRFNLDAQLVLANALAGERRFADAEVRLQAAIAAAGESPRLYRALADVERRRGDVRAAEKSLEKALALDPKSTAARVDLADLYFSGGRTADGARQLRSALAANPSDIDANRAYAAYLTQTNDCAEAEAYWQKVAAASADGSGSVALADYYVYSGRPDDALRVLQPLATREGNVEAKGRLAALLFDRGDREGSARVVDQLLVDEESNVNGLVLKARLSLAGDDLASARDFLHRAAAVDPNAPAVRDMMAVLSK